MADTSFSKIRKTLAGGDAKEALAQLAPFQESHAADPAYLLLKAETHWELVQPVDAIGALKLAIQKNPRHAGAYALLGKYLLNKGLPEQALNFLDRAIALDPSLTAAKRIRNRAERQKQKNTRVFRVMPQCNSTAGPQKNKKRTREKK